MSRTASRIVFSLLSASALLLAAPVSAAVVPVFDWVAARTDSLVGLSGGFGQVFSSALDTNDGSVYYSSFFTGTPDFDPGAGTDSIASNGGQDGFISKFSSAGIYQWTKRWGGASDDFQRSVAIADDGSIYTAGTFAGTVDFDLGAGTTNATAFSGRDAFLVKLDSDGNFQWVKTWGYTGNESAPYGVDTDADGNVFVNHFFVGAIDFDPSAGIATSTSTGSNDVYLSKFASDGTWQWTKTWGGTGDDQSPRFDVADDGSIFTVGIFSAEADFDPGVGAASSTPVGSYDAFLLKLDNDGIYQWSKTLGGTGFDYAGGIGFDGDGSIYAAGYFNSTIDSDLGAGTTNVTSNGASDAFLLKFDVDGTWQWTKTWGGTGNELAYSPIVSGDTLVVPGYFNNTVDFDPSGGTFSKTSNGGLDVFISTFDTDGGYHGTKTFGGSLDDWIDGLTRGIGLDSSKLLFHGFYKSAPADFDPSGAQALHSSNGTSEYLISFNLITPEITQSAPSKTDLTEGASDSLTYTFVLTTPPDDDVVITMTPDDQLLASPTTLTFSSSTWATPQTVTISPVEDDDVEGTHLGEITNTVASNDAQYDGMTLDSVEVTIHDDDSNPDGGSGGSSGHATAVQHIQSQDIAPQPALPALQNNAELIAQIQAKIAELKQQLIELLTQKLKELQAQLAAMQN